MRSRIGGMQSVERMRWRRSRVFTQASFADGALYSYGPSGRRRRIQAFAPFTMDYRDNVTWVKGKAHHQYGRRIPRCTFQLFRHLPKAVPTAITFFAAGSILPQAIQSTNGQYSLPAGSPSPSSIVSFMEASAESLRPAPWRYPGFGPPEAASLLLHAALCLGGMVPRTISR